MASTAAGHALLPWRSLSGVSGSYSLGSWESLSKATCGKLRVSVLFQALLTGADAQAAAHEHVNGDAAAQDKVLTSR